VKSEKGKVMDVNINRRNFLRAGGFGFASMLAGCGGLPTKRTNRRPNIIYILADDLGYGDLGCYGQKMIKTPQLDKMAAQGMRFSRHYSGSTICAPSRCCLMTGLHTGHCRIRGNSDGPLLEEDITVTRLLKSAGYRVGVIGKWGLGDKGTSGEPLKKGADYFCGYLDQVHAHNYYPEWIWENYRKIRLNNHVIPAAVKYAESKGGFADVRNDYTHDIFTNKALEFIENNKDREFFLYLPYTIPHANSESILFDQHGMEVPDLGIYADRDWPEKQKALAAMITRMDGDIGRILQKLGELGIDENTCVIFASDNGPHAAGFNDPHFFNSSGGLRGIKRDLYEGGIRVPMIVRMPGTVKAGTESRHISAFWDFLPTACDIAGRETPGDIDGISFLPELTGKAQQKHNYLYWEFHEQGGHYAVLKGRWKYILLPGGTAGLYDLDSDPAESENIAVSHKEIAAELEKIINTSSKRL
jgi:arylsulfatase A-like enzyme